METDHWVTCGQLNKFIDYSGTCLLRFSVKTNNCGNRPENCYPSRATLTIFYNLSTDKQSIISEICFFSSVSLFQGCVPSGGNRGTDPTESDTEPTESSPEFQQDFWQDLGRDFRWEFRQEFRPNFWLDIQPEILPEFRRKQNRDTERAAISTRPTEYSPAIYHSLRIDPLEVS